MSACSSFGARKKQSAPRSPSANVMYSAIPEARSDFPFFLATTSTTSRNCLFPLWSTIPNIALSIAFCQSSNLSAPGARGPSV